MSVKPLTRCRTDDVAERVRRFPRTRYQGSKRRHLDWIAAQLARESFDTALDAFGGTGAVSYAMKCLGKRVTYNDALAFNHQIGLALIENNEVRLPTGEAKRLGRRVPGREYPTFVADSFRGIYFTQAENRWLDVAGANIRAMNQPYLRAMAWHCVFQAALAKRPYNLFHRRNLYMRKADVHRSFGNKASWDRSFVAHVETFAREASEAVFDSGVACRATCADVLTLEPGFDLVYLDPPYVNARGVGVDYRRFYHFLEGMVRYDEWPELMDMTLKHRGFRQSDAWSDPKQVHDLHAAAFARFRDSTLVLSYRSDGVPSVDSLVQLMSEHKRSVEVDMGPRNQYTLSTNRASREVLVFGRGSRRRFKVPRTKLAR